MNITHEPTGLRLLRRKLELRIEALSILCQDYDSRGVGRRAAAYLERDSISQSGCYRHIALVRKVAVSRYGPVADILFGKYEALGLYSFLKFWRDAHE